MVSITYLFTNAEWEWIQLWLCFEPEVGAEMTSQGHFQPEFIYKPKICMQVSVITGFLQFF